MCTHLKKIYNPYSHKSFYVKCGHCHACLMEKANKRLSRIKNSITSNQVTLFVTLTYAPKFLPYLKPSEVKENISLLNVYRDYDIRKVRKNKDYEISYETYKREKPIKTIDCFSEKVYYDGVRLPRAHGSRNKIGVLVFKDLQDFCKRLERNLIRHYNIPGSCYKMYKIGEYGETYYRPHFHLLIHISSSLLAQFYAAIRESWPYDNQGLERQIEIAKNASSYVSRYLCRDVNFPKFFENKPFRQKASFSKGFGLANQAFSLPHLLSSIDRGIGTFNCVVCRDGKSQVIDLFFPKYFIDRYFVKFKGYSRLSFSEILQLVRCPLSIYSIGQYLGYTIDERGDDYERFLRLFRLRFRRFCEESGITGKQFDLEYFFAYYYYKVWVVLNASYYRHTFDNLYDAIDMLEVYENLEEVRSFSISTNLFQNINDISSVSHPNNFRRIKSRTSRLENDYFSHIKRKKVTNAAYRADGMKI